MELNIIICRLVSNLVVFLSSRRILQDRVLCYLLIYLSNCADFYFSYCYEFQQVSTCLAFWELVAYGLKILCILTSHFLLLKVLSYGDSRWSHWNNTFYSWIKSINLNLFSRQCCKITWVFWLACHFL